ncbi:MAG: sensor histidine kinase, partial [Owenweeksia sp.]
MLLDHIIISFRNIGKHLIINGIIALLIVIFLCPLCFFDLDEWSRAWYLWLYSFFISLALSSGIGKLDERINQQLPWTKQPFTRLIVEVLMVTVYSFVACFIVIFLFHWAFGHFTLANIPWDDIIEQTYNPILVAYGITFFFVSRSFLMEWKQAAVDAEKLRSERLAGQYQVLKDQLNPHFLFNSLNVLSNVVYEDQDKAVDFIQQLSRFYRYVLDVQHEEVVSLEKELEFAHRYLYLQKLRFEDKLKVEVEAVAGKQDRIPPLALQLCLENAIKHNEVSAEHPLYIRICRAGNKLCISNNIQRKTVDLPESSGEGGRHCLE